MTGAMRPGAHFDCSLEDGYGVTFAHRAGEQIMLLISLTNPFVCVVVFILLMVKTLYILSH